MEIDPGRDCGAHLDAIDPDAIPDRRLALMLVCAHPAINPAVHTPLMLNTVLGFTAEQIGRAFAIPSKTLAARLVRAKRRIKDARIPFRIPDRDVLPGRMPAVLEAVYGAHAIDWHSSGAEVRESLTTESSYLAQTLVDVAPGDAEALGLAALICLSNARLPARFDTVGNLVPLPEQDVALWDGALIDRGIELLRAAHPLGDLGRFQLEAAMQAVHIARRDTGATDWPTLRELHQTLDAVAPSLGGTVASAVVTAEIDGPAAGLALLDAISDETTHFQPAWSARAHLLDRLGRREDAIAAFDKAISLTTDPAERRHLARRREGST